MIGTYNRDAIARVRREIDECERQLDLADERARVSTIQDPAELLVAARSMPAPQRVRMLRETGVAARYIDAVYDAADDDLLTEAERNLGKEIVDRLLQEVPRYCRLKIASPISEPTYEVVDVDIPGTPEPVYDEAGKVVGSLPVKPTTRKVRRRKSSANDRAAVEPVAIEFPAASPPAAFVRLDERRKQGLLYFSTYGEYDSKHTPLITLHTPVFIDGTEMLESVFEDWMEIAPALAEKLSSEPLSEAEASKADSRARSARAMFGGGGLPPWPRRARRLKEAQ